MPKKHSGRKRGKQPKRKVARKPAAKKVMLRPTVRPAVPRPALRPPRAARPFIKPRLGEHIPPAREDVFDRMAREFEEWKHEKRKKGKR